MRLLKVSSIRELNTEECITKFWDLKLLGIYKN